MITVQNATQEYVLGNGAHEQERLKMQARILEKYGAPLKGLVLFETISRMMSVGLAGTNRLPKIWASMNKLRSTFSKLRGRL